MKLFRFLVPVLLCVFTLNSCDFEDPEFTNVRDVKFLNLDGRKVNMEFTVDCTNPNKFGFKVKPSTLDVTVDNEKLGIVHLDEKLKIKRLSTNSYRVPLSLTLENGALFRLAKYVTREKVDLKLEGKVRGSVFGFGRSFDVKETRSIDGSLFKLKLD